MKSPAVFAFARSDPTVQPTRPLAQIAADIAELKLPQKGPGLQECEARLRNLRAERHQLRQEINARISDYRSRLATGITANGLGIEIRQLESRVAELDGAIDAARSELRELSYAWKAEVGKCIIAAARPLRAALHGEVGELEAGIRGLEHLALLAGRNDAAAPRICRDAAELLNLLRPLLRAIETDRKVMG